MTLDSGQVFHWEKAGAGFVGAIGDLAVYLEQQKDILKASGSALRLDGFKPSSFQRVVSHYFALDHQLAEICASFPDDPAMNAARKFCRGLRVIRQPKWECLATFICSSMKQVAHIRQISRSLREQFGDARKIDPPSPRLRRGKASQTIDTFIVYTFPSAERIAQSSEKELRKCALGYRAKNLLVTARVVASGDVDLEKLGTLSNVDLCARLCELPGVGAKVAN